MPPREGNDFHAWRDGHKRGDVVRQTLRERNVPSVVAKRRNGRREEIQDIFISDNGQRLEGPIIQRLRILRNVQKSGNLFPKMFERLLFGFVVSGVVDIVVVRIGNGEVLPRLRSDDFDGDTGFCFRPVRLAIEVPVSEIHGNIGVACFQGDRQADAF